MLTLSKDETHIVVLNFSGGVTLSPDEGLRELRKHKQIFDKFALKLFIRKGQL